MHNTFQSYSGCRILSSRTFKDSWASALSLLTITAGGTGRVLSVYSSTGWKWPKKKQNKQKTVQSYLFYFNSWFYDALVGMQQTPLPSKNNKVLKPDLIFNCWESHMLNGVGVKILILCLQQSVTMVSKDYFLLNLTCWANKNK